MDTQTSIAALGAISSLFGKGSTPNQQSSNTSSSANNSLSLIFNPTLGGLITGSQSPSTSGTLTNAPSSSTGLTSNPTQTSGVPASNPLAALFSPTTPAGRYDVNSLPGSAGAVNLAPAPGVQAQLSSSTLLLLGGLLLLLTLSIKHKH